MAGKRKDKRDKGRDKNRDRGGGKDKNRFRKEMARTAFPDDLVVEHLDVESSSEAITKLLNSLVMAGRIDLGREDEVRKQILDRERVASTGIGLGVAIPHCKTKWADRLGLAVGISQQGLDFRSHDGQSVHVVMLWVCPPGATKEHLALMRTVASIARDPDAAEGVRRSKDRLGLLQFLDTVEMPEKR